MKVIETELPEVLIFEPTVHGDDRGYFMETWRESTLQDLGLDYRFVQDNQSKSSKGTLRGLHYQLQFPQGKLVRVLSGEVFDVAVDMRRGSSSFGKSVGVVLSASNNRQLWVPPGFAHGFYVTSETAEISYKCTQYYHAEDDNSLLWNDAALNIAWPLDGEQPLLSNKDAQALPLAQAASYS